MQIIHLIHQSTSKPNSITKTTQNKCEIQSTQNLNKKKHWQQLKLNRTEKETKMTLAPIFQVIATKNGQDKSTEILAAVGAGLVPATMAFIAPMVLGRRRRRSADSTTEHPYQLPPHTHSPLTHPLFM